MKNQKILIKFVKVLLTALILLGLYVMAEVNYLLFHSLVEIFSVVVACTLFIIVYNSKVDKEQNAYLILLGVAYLFVGLTDLVHVLAYSGMGIFQEGGGNLATQLWIAGRYLEVFSLLGAFIVYKKKVICKNANYLLGFYSFIFTLLMLSIFWWNIFPVCFVEGAGLTRFKVISEYFIVGLLLILIALVYKNRKIFIKGNDKLILKIVVFTMLAELAFTFYVGVYDISNFIGHIFKLISFYYVYKFIVKNLIKEPQEVLYEKLSEKERKYRELSEEFELILDHIPDIIYYKDNHNSFLKVNKSLAKAHGMTKEELEGKSLFDLYPEDEAREYWEDDMEVLETKKPKLNIIEPWSPDENRCVKTSKIPYIVNGEVRGIVGISTDITKQKKKEQQIKNERKKFKKIFHSSNDAMYIHNLTKEGMPGRFVEVNSTACKMLGYTREELLDMSPKEIDAGEKSKKMAAIMEKLVRAGSMKFEMTHQSKDGKCIPVEIHSHIFKLDGKDRVLSVARDISDRLKKEKKLVKLNEYLTKIFDNTNMWINVLDKEGNVLIWNRAAEEISGYSAEEAKGNNKIWKLLYPEKAYWKKVFQKVKNIIQNDETVEGYETIITDKAGNKKYIQCTYNSLKDKDGQIIGSVAIGRNVTNIKKMRAREKELQKEIAEREKMYHLGQMSAGVAHEINNPLTNILTTAQLLLEEDINAQYRDDIEIIRKNTERIAATVKGFLGFTKDRDFKFRAVDVNKLLDKTIKLVDKDRRDDIEILKKYDRNMSNIKTSSFHLEEVFVNLIKNALESMESSPEKVLTLKTEVEGKYVRISIKDTGEGIKQENFKKLFEPYFTTKGKKGTGLGLPTCKYILKKLDGKINVKSEGKGNGIEFILILPLAKKEKGGKSI